MCLIYMWFYSDSLVWQVLWVSKKKKKKSNLLPFPLNYLVPYLYQYSSNESCKIFIFEHKRSPKIKMSKKKIPKKRIGKKKKKVSCFISNLQVYTLEINTEYLKLVFVFFYFIFLFVFPLNKIVRLGKGEKIPCAQNAFGVCTNVKYLYKLICSTVFFSSSKRKHSLASLMSMIQTPPNTTKHHNKKLQ